MATTPSISLVKDNLDIREKTTKPNFALKIRKYSPNTSKAKVKYNMYSAPGSTAIAPAKPARNKPPNTFRSADSLNPYPSTPLYKAISPIAYRHLAKTPIKTVIYTFPFANNTICSRPEAAASFCGSPPAFLRS